MNRLIAFFARQGLFSELLTFLVIGIGLYSMVTIKKEVFPNVQYDVITIYTYFPGSAPSEVEKLITNPLEQDLKEVDGIKKMFSTSIEGLSVVVIQLDPDQTTQEEAKADVQDVIDRFEELPDQAEDPLVTALESNIIPIVEVTLSGGKDAFALKEAARYVENELEKVRGVSRVDVQGEREYEIRVEISAKKLQRYQISLLEVVQVLQDQNVSIPGGTFTQIADGIEKDVILRTDGQFEGVEDVKKTIIRSNDLGRPIVLEDVAKIFMSLKEEQLAHRVNGKESIRLVVMKKENADAIDMIDTVKSVLPGSEKSLSSTVPILSSEKLDGVSFEVVNDLSNLIRRRLGVLSNNLIVGLILVVLVLSLFLPWKVALVTAIGIPFSFLGTMTFFDLQGISLNLITMMGLIIVVGMLVDDAVVVTENAVREMEDGASPMDGAIKSTQRIWTAIFASVMTTVLAFFPMTIMTGVFGKFISFIPLGVICALIISLLECYFILPYHIGRWVTLEDVKPNKIGFKGAFDRFWSRVIDSYGSLLSQITRFRYLVLVGFIALIAVTLLNIASNMKVVLFPPEGVDVFIIKAKAPIATSLEQTTEFVAPIEDLVASLPKHELKNFVTTVGEMRQREDMPSERGSHLAMIKVYLSAATERERTAGEIIDSLRSRVQDTDKLEVFFERVNAGPPVGSPINIGVRGDKYEEIMPLVEEIQKDLEKIKGTKDITNNFSEGKDQVIVRVKSEEARSVGLSARTVGMTVMAAYEGIAATTIQDLNDEIDIRVSLPEEEKLEGKKLSDLKILNPMGQLISLNTIADFQSEKGIESYSHMNNARQVTITGDVDTDLISATEVSNLIRKKEAEYIKKNPNLSLAFAGEDEDTQESLQSLLRAFILALLLIYFLLILTFQSFVWPMIIILVIPIGVVSVSWALFLHGEPLSFMGMLGVVALAGVIVNNSIVFVDFVIFERENGSDFFQSIVSAGQKRLRPIVLTTLTTVCGILPTAYGIGGLDPFVVPIALALGWGMLIGSILSSIFLPAFVSIFDDLRGRKKAT